MTSSRRAAGNTRDAETTERPLGHPYVPFNRPHSVGSEQAYIAEALAGSHLAADGPFTQRCSEWLTAHAGCAAALLTNSGTAALEAAAIAAGISLGDEVIMPSYAYVSTANAFVLRGAVPVFVDIREDTLNLDEALLEDAITDATRAVVPVHYGGVSAEMDSIRGLTEGEGLALIEDAAHGLMSTYHGRPLGSSGGLAAISFHETKNIISGEGGALLVNDESLLEAAEVARSKGTDRSRFLRGEVDRYTWRGIGSSYALSELGAAFLWGQLEEAERITARRLAAWDLYHGAFEPLEAEGLIRRPIIPPGARHNAHMYYLLLNRGFRRDRFIAGLADAGVEAVFHYVPLHSSPAGRRYGRAQGKLPVTEDMWKRIIRLPLWIGMDEPEVGHVKAAVERLLRQG